MPAMNENSKIEMILTSREKDLGGFSVRRLLPYATHRMVGPFIFFDHMGPATFAPGDGMSVRPHPHINLATVTYLFEGVVRHRDSLGSDQWIEPGAVNWMTAGRGIVHSERTPEEARKTGSRMNGIQLWVALPEEFEEVAPSFFHHPKNTLPEFRVGEVSIKLLLGKAFGHVSPVKLHSRLFYAEAHLPKGASLKVPAESQELAAYLVSGKIRTEDQNLEMHSMIIAKSKEDLEIEALEDSHVMILGGDPVGPRTIFWNFVSSDPKRLQHAKEEWAPGPRKESSRFHPIPGDDQEFIPLPPDNVHVKGTIL